MTQKSGSNDAQKGTTPFKATVIRPTTVFKDKSGDATQKLDAYRVLNGLSLVKKEDLQEEHLRAIKGCEKAGQVSQHGSVWRSFISFDYIKKYCNDLIAKGKIGGIVYNDKFVSLLTKEAKITPIVKSGLSTDGELAITSKSTFEDGTYLLDCEQPVFHFEIADFVPMIYKDYKRKIISSGTEETYALSPLAILSEIQEYEAQGYFAVFTPLSDVVDKKHFGLYDLSLKRNVNPFNEASYLQVDATGKLKEPYASKSGKPMPFGVSKQSAMLFVLSEGGNKQGVVFSFTDATEDASKSRDLAHKQDYYDRLMSYRGYQKQTGILKNLWTRVTNNPFPKSKGFNVIKQVYNRITRNGSAEYVFSKKNMALLQSLLRLQRGQEVIYYPELRIAGKSPGYIDLKNALNEEGLLHIIRDTSKMEFFDQEKKINPKANEKLLTGFKVNMVEIQIPSVGIEYSRPDGSLGRLQNFRFVDKNLEENTKSDLLIADDSETLEKVVLSYMAESNEVASVVTGDDLDDDTDYLDEENYQAKEDSDNPYSDETDEEDVPF